MFGKNLSDDFLKQINLFCSSLTKNIEFINPVMNIEHVKKWPEKNIGMFLFLRQ